MSHNNLNNEYIQENELNQNYDDEEEDDQEYQDYKYNNNYKNFKKKNQQKNNVINLEELKKFIGSNYQFGGYSECVFCAKYFPSDMKIGDCCGHCWAFCFNAQLDLKNFTYDGPHTVDEVKKFLNKTFSLHPKDCNNKECIYNKINQYHKDKTLNNEIALILGLEIKNEEQKLSNIKNKRRNVNINFKLSSISI
jgi:hypothetical protein